jgi:transcriptional regulator with XRE-family HTH domain
MSPTPRQLGKKLKALRRQKAMSQNRVASEAGISREYLARLEAGRYDPTVGTLTRIAKALDVRLTELIG